MGNPALGNVLPPVAAIVRKRAAGRNPKIQKFWGRSRPQTRRPEARPLDSSSESACTTRPKNTSLTHPLAWLNGSAV